MVLVVKLFDKVWGDGIFLFTSLGSDVRAGPQRSLDGSYQSELTHRPRVPQQMRVVDLQEVRGARDGERPSARCEADGDIRHGETRRRGRARAQCALENLREAWTVVLTRGQLHGHVVHEACEGHAYVACPAVRERHLLPEATIGRVGLAWVVAGSDQLPLIQSGFVMSCRLGMISVKPGMLMT